MALSAARSTQKLDDGVIPQLLSLPVAASVNIHQGSLVVIDSSGYARPGRASTTDVAVGRSETLESAVSGTGANNSSGSAGAVQVSVRQGCFKWTNGSNADAITFANVGQLCYVRDDGGVDLTNGGGTKTVAGIIVRVDSDGVYVSTFLNAGTQALSETSVAADRYSTLAFYMPLATIADGDMVVKFIPGFSGKIVSIQAVVATVATTSGKASTLTPQTNAAGVGADVPTTGGDLALTSANMTPVGNVVAGSAITAANSFGATDGISIKAASTTTFIQGAATIILTLQAIP